MDRYTRGFILASLVYLAAGGVMGALMRGLPETYAYLRFAHVHVLLGGFMAMMVFGVGYFILPRFAARTLEWPAMVGWHFWLANLALLAMAAADPLDTALASPLWSLIGNVGAGLLAITFLMFTANLGLTLLRAPAPAPAKAAPAPAPASGGQGRPLPMAPAPGPSARPLGPGTPVAEVVDRKEGALKILLEAGLEPLRDPAHLQMVRARGVTLGHACERHGIPLEAILARLESLPDRAAPGGGVEIGPDQIIGALVERHPAAREVLRRRFGEGCFTCPGFNTETLAQGAMMHGVAVEELLDDLRATIQRGA